MIYQHPEFDSESTYLEQVLAFMRQKIRQARTDLGIKDEEKDEGDVAIQQQSLGKVIQELEPHLEVPYIGRIVYKDDDADIPENFYIGYVYLELPDGNHILNWRSTFAGAVWNASNQFYVTYRDNARQQVEGELFLKRNLKIEDGKLKDIADLIDRRQKSDKTPTMSEVETLIDPDDYLRLILQGKLGKGLEDIVASIQQEQQSLIRADADQILIVQGAAGSGKTSVALHRISVLSYHQNETYIEPTRILIIGSSPVFLEFVASQVLMTRLDIQQVSRQTFASWSARLVRKEYKFSDKTFDQIFDKNLHPNTRRDVYLRSRFKGRLEFRYVLEKALDAYRMAASENPLTYKPGGFGNLDQSYSVPESEIARFVTETSHLAVNPQRDAVLSRVVRYVQNAHREGYKRRVQELQALVDHPPVNVTTQKIAHWRTLLKPYSSDLLNQTIGRLRGELRAELDTAERRTRMRAEIQREHRERGEPLDETQLRARIDQRVQSNIEKAIQTNKEFQSGFETLEAAQQRALQRVESEIADLVKQDFAQRYPTIQPEAVYSRLLSHADELHHTAHEWFKESELKILLDESLNPRSEWRVEDLAPLTYLNLLLNGKPIDTRSYDHIVIDEAQDLAPLQFWLLRQFVSSGSMTILGDMAQSIHSYRGLNSWDELDPVFKADRVSFKKLTRTYRSTHEIVSFANEILAGDVLKEKYPQAIPFERHGAVVEWHFAESQEAWLKTIEEQIEGFLQKSYRNIAIITKTLDELNMLEKHFRRAKFDPKTITSPNDHYPGGVVLIPVHLTKGMEFEACLLANVDETHYPNTELDGRMLYVASTRALHDLVLVWRGTISPHLAHLQE